MPNRLFRRRRGGGHESSNTSDAVLVDYRISGNVGLEQLDEFYERIGYRGRMDDGLLVHIGGTLGDEVVYISIWSNEQLGVKSWQEKRHHIEDILASTDPNAVVVRRSNPVHRLILGDDLDEFRAAPAVGNPECVGYVIDLPEMDTKAYELIVNAMDFPEQFPPGLLLHSVGQVDDMLRVTSIWRTASQSRRFFENRVMPALVAVVRDHGVFPEVRPVELCVHLLAVGDELLD